MPQFFRNILPIQVRFSDVDIMGHVSNTVYQNYFDSGKINYFDEVLPDMDFKLSIPIPEHWRTNILAYDEEVTVK